MKKHKNSEMNFVNETKSKETFSKKRQLSLGIASCMLSLTLFVSMTKVDQIFSSPTSEQLQNAVEETSVNTSEELLTENEIQAIRDKANSLENDYYFNGNMVEELKAELRKAKADPSVNYEEAKARLINEAILKNTPAQKAPGEDRAVKKFNIKDADKLEAGMTVINVRGKGMETGQIIEVLVNGVKKGSYTQVKSVKSSVKITLTEALKENDKVKAILKGSDGVQIAATEETTAKKAEPKKAEKYKDTLKMPSGEIWIEQYVANIVNDEEKAEALDMLKKANSTEIANDIKSIDFKIEGVETKTASYTVTYKDNSKTEKISAPDLTIKEVTEYSAATNVEKLVVTDTKITGKLVPQKKVDEGKFEPDPNGTIAEGTKVIAILKPSGNNNVNKNYCTGKCTTDKDSSKIGEADVNSDGTFEINVPDGFDYKQEVGLTVKEPHKFKACNSTTVEYVIPKVPVRDPKKLTDEEKKAIDTAIRKANTIVKEDGSEISKLPDWKVNNIPAFIEIDKEGNVKIINPSEVAGDWIDNFTKFVPKRNPDGSFQMKTEYQNSGIPVTKEELLENKAPDAPTITTNADEGKITITPNPLDTDAKKVEVIYTDPKGASKTATATKGDNGEWEVPEGSDISVDKTSGVVTITLDKIKNKTNVSATVTDDGFIANDDADDKTSDNKSEFIRVLPKKPDIKVDDKTGDVTITPIEKKSDRVAKKMDVTYTPAGATESKTVTFTRDNEGKWSIEGESDFEVSQDGKIITIKNGKIKANTGLTAQTNDADETDKLVSDKNEVTIPDKTAPEAPQVSINTNDGAAQITPPTDKDTKTITVKYPDPNGNEKTAIATKGDNGEWTVTGDNGETVDKESGVITIPKGNYKTEEPIIAYGSDNAQNKSTEAKKTPVEVSFDVDGGKKGIDSCILAKGEEYVLPEYNKQDFPENKEFDGWQVGNETKKAGETLKIENNTTIKAIWKDIEYKVSFDGNSGTGSMAEATVKAGKEFELPENKFTAPEGQEFDGWMVGSEKKAVGDKITVNGDVEVKAIWKDKVSTPSTEPSNPNETTNPGSSNETTNNKINKNHSTSETKGDKVAKTGINSFAEIAIALIALAGGLFTIKRRKNNKI